MLTPVINIISCDGDEERKRGLINNVLPVFSTVITFKIFNSIYLLHI